MGQLPKEGKTQQEVGPGLSAWMVARLASHQSHPCPGQLQPPDIWLFCLCAFHLQSSPNPLVPLPHPSPVTTSSCSQVSNPKISTSSSLPAVSCSPCSLVSQALHPSLSCFLHSLPIWHWPAMPQPLSLAEARPLAEPHPLRATPSMRRNSTALSRAIPATQPTSSLLPTCWALPPSGQPPLCPHTRASNFCQPRLSVHSLPFPPVFLPPQRSFFCPTPAAHKSVFSSSFLWVLFHQHLNLFNPLSSSKANPPSLFPSSRGFLCCHPHLSFPVVPHGICILAAHSGRISATSQSLPPGLPAASPAYLCIPRPSQQWLPQSDLPLVLESFSCDALTRSPLRSRFTPSLPGRSLASMVIHRSPLTVHSEGWRPQAPLSFTAAHSFAPRGGAGCPSLLSSTPSPF